MKKEVFLAIFAGIVAGLILAFGAWRLTDSIKKKPEPDVDNTKTTQPATPKSGFSITIDKPANLDVITTEKVDITGLTNSDSIIIISTKAKDYLVTPEKNGSFSTTISLSAGLNDFNLTSLDTSGTSTATQLALIYSSEFEKYLSQDDDNEESTSSAETIREKVQQKLEATLLKATAYLGTITDITENTIQLKSDNNGIQQIMTSSDTSYESDEDLALGDQIIAMGFVNGNKVLDTKRIMVVEDYSQNDYQAIWANISDVSGKKVTYTTPEGNEFDIDFPKTWVGPDINDLEIGNNYILTGTIKDSTLTLRSIFEIDD